MSERGRQPGRVEYFGGPLDGRTERARGGRPSNYRDDEGRRTVVRRQDWSGYCLSRSVAYNDDRTAYWDRIIYRWTVLDGRVVRHMAGVQ